MIEYLHNAIRATAGEDITVSAKITDENGLPITTGFHLSLYSDNERLDSFSGKYSSGVWEFTIAADATTDLRGRYWYCICSDNTHEKLNFKQPIYLV